MAFIVGHVSCASKPCITHQIRGAPSPSASPRTLTSALGKGTLSASTAPPTKLESPPVRRSANDDGKEAAGAQVKKKHDRNNGTNNNKEEFYVALGTAVRTLREDLPLLFSKELDYSIYRDDITFLDPLNTFRGIDNYKLIFWGLRFHGRILFREISLEIFRVWQPSENVILTRWNLRGVPRVPWEAKGQFQGTSRYKLDRNGKIYEHKVDNLAFNFPQTLKPMSVLDLVRACPASPNLTFLSGSSEMYTSSWLQFYHAVRETLDQGGYVISTEGMVTCSS